MVFRAETAHPRRRIAPRLAMAFAGATALTAVGAAPALADPITDAMPTGVEASFVIFDRATGASSVQFDAHKQYRAASVVKLLIALDYLESHDPQTISSEDSARLQAMLRSSDDDAASYLWIENGWDKIVERMVAKLGLTDTMPPADRGMWGYTAISAADVVTTYRYILDTASPAVRDFIMSNLHESTKCGQDGFDQSFGIARALARPTGVKQGWSGFGDAPEPDDVCAPENPEPPIPPGALDAVADSSVVLGRDGVGENWTFTEEVPRSAPAINLSKRAMHTTGTVGEHDEKIIVLLTLEPTGTPWDVSSQRITLLTKAIDLANWSEATGLGSY
ncbi:hypothetical protein OHB12_23055 [Nocardia sp. NBC_01730]|uniref:hypothetical protein n=1 Tax=Nocardia sp. NBC_01730 TaxID=2975998 RepID=UPI002E13DC8A|nr:hypothetical protein OHB12_23055 [Nocardia sp. NBC_01730]